MFALLLCTGESGMIISTLVKGGRELVTTCKECPTLVLLTLSQELQVARSMVPREFML